MVDLGCGNGSASNLIDSDETEYIGVDLVVPASSDNKTFIAANIETDLDLLASTRAGNTLFFCANVLCYLDDLEGVSRSIGGCARRGDFLAVIEPSGWLWWETFFYEIRVFLRSRESLDKHFSQSGWNRIDQSGMYLVALAGKPFFMTSSILLFRKQ